MTTPAPDAPARPLRAWQRRALATYHERQPRDFLAVATPGAGKTTFALVVAADLLSRAVVKAVTVVAPTEHLKRQWATAAAEVGIALDPEFRNTAGMTSSDFTGVAVTYAQVAAHPALHRARTERRRTLVILDEVHHAGDALSWGDAAREAFTGAARRLSLTGTPFRSDINPIPFVTYAPGPDGIPRSAADSSYGYADALRDSVVRPVLFLAYSGQTRWRTSAGEEMSAMLGEPLNAEQTAAAWRTALDPRGDWMPAVLRAADSRLAQKRAQGMPDAGGLVIASDHASARAYAGLLEGATGEQPVLVLSDDPTASARIEAFRSSRQRWMVAVRMVSEGVDIPRLAVGVYATSVSTPLFFAQAVGRFVRGRGRAETASIFLPSVPALLALAAAMEVERDHILAKPDSDGLLDDGLLREANREQNEAGEEPTLFEALEASAQLDRVIYDGDEFGATGQDDDGFLGLPGLLEPEQVAALLKQREAAQLAAMRSRPTRAAAQEPPAPTPLPTVQVLKNLKAELNRLVAAHHHRTGKPHGAIHAELRRTTGGPATAGASTAELQQRIEVLRRWASGR